jgi:Carboxypeptidase regulatory-like domain
MSTRATFFFFLCWFACTAMAQQISVPNARSGSIIGTVTDVQDDVVPGAMVVLDGEGASEQQMTTTNPNGFFSFSAVQPHVSYHVTIRANGFVDWTSPPTQITPGQDMDMGSIRLTISVAGTTVVAALPPEQIATEEVHVAEKQRALGFIPAFYAVYDPHPAPLTPKLKFTLAYRTAIDPVTLLGTAFIAGINQASDTPAYVQGMKGYGQRFGANYANDVTDVFIGGAILPTILHQDPRYYYQGTGSTRSRMWHAIRNPFVCKGDNGQWQPNYSSLGGYLASGAIANTYYPTSNRGPGRVFSTTGVDIGADIANAIIQEFIVHRGKK